jgi:hypothetical protein
MSWFNSTCTLCSDGEEWCSAGLCSNCSEIRKIVSIYGVTRVLNTCKRVFVREEAALTNRTGAEERGKLEGVKTRSSNNNTD